MNTIASSCHRYFARVLCNPFVSIELVDEQGVKIIDDTARDRPAGAALSGEPGVYVVTATIPPMLRAGTYMVWGWIGNEFEVSSLSRPPRDPYRSAGRRPPGVHGAPAGGAAGDRVEGPAGVGAWLHTGLRLTSPP